MGAVEGERKTVTALFADIKGSTELMRHLDPEEARAIIDLANQADDRCGTLLQRVRRRPATRFLHRSVRRARRRLPRLMLRYRGATFGSFVAITLTHGGISDGNHFNRWMRLWRDPL